MNCEVLAVGTELLLGPTVDTNSTWIGEQLAATGIDSYFHTAVGDNQRRIVEALRIALERSDAVIVTGGLGPTPDDITREAIAEVMGVKLELDLEQLAHIEAIFLARGRPMAPNNARQAWRPAGSTVISQFRGTAPGLICPVGERGGERGNRSDLGDRVVYALPGVPHEMMEMMQRAVLPDLLRRAGPVSVIVSRTLRTWGVSESALAELVARRLEALDVAGSRLTLAFLAKGIEGIHLRITAKESSVEAAHTLLDAEEAQLRVILGTVVFGVDEQTMEAVVGALLADRGLTLAVAESITGGMVASRLVSVPGASTWLRGGVVSYVEEVKYNVLGVPEGPVVTEAAAVAMAEGVRHLLGADIGIGVTGVAGPTEEEGQPVGTVFGGFALPGRPAEAVRFHAGGDRQQIRESATISLLNILRLHLLTEHS